MFTGLIGEAERITKSQSAMRGAIVICIDRGNYRAASYGRTKAECNNLGKMLDALCKKMDTFIANDNIEKA